MLYADIRGHHGKNGTTNQENGIWVEKITEEEKMINGEITHKEWAQKNRAY